VLYGTLNLMRPGLILAVGGGTVLLLAAGWFMLSHLVMGTATGDAIGESLGVALALLVVASIVGSIRSGRGNHR
jgi:hypothetical protein